MKTKILTVLSGKGGTGKTSLTASLAVLLAEKKRIIAVDCDVDAPNLALALGSVENTFSWKPVYTSEKAVLIPEKCMGCKKCVSTCVFSAISWNEQEKKPIFDKFLCEGCGTCQLVCPAKAIKLKKVKNGKIGSVKSKYGFTLISGQLKPGESGSGNIVTEVRSFAEKLSKKQKTEIMLIDAAAGIGCPVIASVNDSDYIVAITEPTPTAFTDLKRALQVVEHFRIPYGLIINRYDINKKTSQKIENFAEKYGIPVLGKIPYNKNFVKALVELKPIVTWDKSASKLFSEILNRVLANLGS